MIQQIQSQSIRQQIADQREPWKTNETQETKKPKRQSIDKILLDFYSLFNTLTLTPTSIIIFLLNIQHLRSYSIHGSGEGLKKCSIFHRSSCKQKCKTVKNIETYDCHEIYVIAHQI